VIAAGPQPAGVVQVRVRPSFGTGYLLAPGLVLTAAHVAMSREGEPAAEIAIQVPGAQPVPGTVVWWRRDERADAALVRLAEPAAPPRRSGPAVRFGRFVTAEPGRPVEAIGFPRQQKFDSLRDQEQLVGAVNPQTGALSGHYELTSSTPLPAADPGSQGTVWSGMSGSAVFGSGLLVGVLRADRRARFGARLTATPIAGLLGDEEFRRIVGEAAGWDPVCEPVELAPFLESPYRNTDLRSVATLLRADAAAVGFHGRESELEHLAAWCAGPETFAVSIITGQGGEGKSRLARQLLDRQRNAGWATGLVRPTAADGDAGFALVERAAGPLLLAVDYAENHQGLVRALLRRARAAAGPVRVLLLARDKGTWSDALDEPDAAVREALADAPELALGPLASTAAAWDDAFDRAVRDIAGVLRSVPGYEEPDWPAVAGRIAPPPAETSMRPASVLGIQLTALTALLQQAMPVPAEPGEPVERIVLRHEEAYWTRTALRHRLPGLDRLAMRRAVASLLLVIVADRTQAVRLLQSIGVHEAEITAEWLRALYPQHEDRYLGLLQPDRLAEFLLVDACTAEPDLLRRIVSAAANLGRPAPRTDAESGPGTGSAASFGQMWALREAVRAARSQAGFDNPVRPLLTQIEQTASSPVVSDETLAWTVSNAQMLPAAGRRQDVRQNPDGSQTITGVLDAASAALSVAGYRRGVHNLVVDDQRGQGHVHFMNSVTLGQLGRREEALAESALAVACFRSAPDARDDLAVELHRQAELLAELGRDDEAAAALREELALSAHVRPELRAPALNLLIEVLCRAGQLADAERYARQEIDLLLPQSPKPTAADARTYVRSLGRYAEIQVGTGAPAAALENCRRADSFVAGLPTATRNGIDEERALLAEVRARALALLGDRSGSVAAWLDSAACWNAATESRFGFDPASRAITSLNNAAVGYAEQGDQDRALDTIASAVAFALSERGEPFRRDRPERYVLVHATYVGYLLRANRTMEALGEAEILRDRATSPLPVALANSMREAALTLAGCGRLAEATRASGIAVDALRTADPAEHGMLMATAFADHAANLAETGRGAEGAAAGAQAAAHWRRICENQPALRINLVHALANQAACLRLDRRYAEAAPVYADAAAQLRALPGDPAGHRATLAHLLGDEAYCRFETGDFAAAAQASEAEAEVRGALWRDDLPQGTTLGPATARAFVDLAAARERLGRYSAALDSAGQALRIFEFVLGRRLGRYWQDAARAHLVAGSALMNSGRPVAAVAPFVNGMAIALENNGRELARACHSGVFLAHGIDRAGVAAQWRRLTGYPFPDDVDTPPA